MDSPMSASADPEPKPEQPASTGPGRDEQDHPDNRWTEADWLQLWLKLARERKQATRS